jgi:SUKH-3 immunity protein of toxin-antitoxin system
MTEAAEVDPRDVLTEAGWFPGRCDHRVADWERELSEKGGLVMHDAARTFLQEFGGLSLGKRTSSSGATRLTFDLDPTLALWEGDRFDDASRKVGDSLYPVGEAMNGQEFIAIGERGDVYLVMDMVHHLATTAWSALESLIRRG